jgi:hypothetical protein
MTLIADNFMPHGYLILSFLKRATIPNNLWKICPYYFNEKNLYFIEGRYSFGSSRPRIKCTYYWCPEQSVFPLIVKSPFNKPAIITSNFDILYIQNLLII